jgi:hypothetical protein
MRSFSGLFALLICCSLSAHADVIPPQEYDARQRLRESPDIFDRTDNYCQGKKPRMACVIAGSTFAGGGEGTCVNQVADGGVIDLSCVRNENIEIDRKLPVDGFVADESVCAAYHGEMDGQKYNCTPLNPTPADQFCKGRPVGGACTVVLTYKGKQEKHAGVCRKITQSESYYHWGHRTMTREVIQCEPPAIPERTYTPVDWKQKLIP